MRVTALAAVALVAVVWALLHVGWYAHGQIVDYGVYEGYGTAVVQQHEVPYRDFPVEYPPAALPVFVLPALGGDYRTVFQLVMAACAAAAAVGALLAGGRFAAAATALAPLALGSVVLSRFDFWPAALAVLALAAALRRRPALSGVLLGTGFAAKLWPVLLAPLLLVWLARRSGSRAVVRWTLAAVVTAAVWFVPFTVLSPGGIGHSFHAQLARPLQLESLGAAVLIAAHHVAGTTLSVTESFGSQNVSGPGTQAAATATTVAGLLALALLCLAFARGRPTGDDLVRACAAAVAVAIAFGKVFSPQFLVWLMPLVPLVRGRRALLSLPLFASALVLTQSWFPYRYWDLAIGLAPAQSWTLLARDLCVVALAGVLAWRPLEHQVLREGRSRLEALERVRAQVE